MGKFDNKKFGKKVARLLKAQDLLQKDFAKTISMDPASLSRILAGDKMPSADMVARIATALHVTSDYLLNIEKEDEDFNIDKEIRVLSRNLHKINNKEKRQLVEALFED